MQKYFKSFFRKWINKFGFDVVRVKNQHEGFSQHLLNVFNTYQIDCVLDVGANAGQYGQFLRRLGYSGWIVSFEPVVNVYEKLRNVIQKDPKWVAYNIALGNVKGDKNLNVYSSTVFSSFLSANEYSKEIWSSLNDCVTESVHVDTLDNIFLSIKNKTGAQNFYLKLDTQGYDQCVYGGALDILDDIRSIQVELSLIHIYENMDSAYKFLEKLAENNFLVSGMYPINRDKSLAVIEYDCVLVKKKIAGASN